MEQCFAENCTFAQSWSSKVYKFSVFISISVCNFELSFNLYWLNLWQQFSFIALVKVLQVLLLWFIFLENMVGAHN